MRSPDEIVARVKMLDEDGGDFFGFQRTDLVSVLDFEHAQPFLRPEATAADWETPPTDDELRQRAIDYLTFAFEKAQNHRGISAGRSVDHFSAWLWLLGILPDNWEDIDYAQYGVPKLFAACGALGQPVPTDPDLVNMSQGIRCVPDCEEGCG